jgi:nitrogen fixation protein FixH
MDQSSRVAPTSPEAAGPGRRLTGRAVFIILVAFFGIVFTVNAVMISLALDTLPGTVTDSAYRASQRYNQTLAEARERAERGWTVDAHVAREPSGTAAVTMSLRDRSGAPLERVTVTARLLHPAHRSNDRAFDVGRTGPGAFAGTADHVAPGAYDLVIAIEREGETPFRTRNRVILP